jgi:hypothetical protein
MFLSFKAATTLGVAAEQNLAVEAFFGKAKQTTAFAG